MNLERTNFVVVDVETTGIESETDRLCEVGFVLFSRERGTHAYWHTLVNPEIPIPPEASAIHHITDEDVVDAPTQDQAIAELATRLPAESIFTAHHLPFEASFLPTVTPENPSLRLCSLRLARHLYPEHPSHKNQALRYRLKVKPDLERLVPAEDIYTHRILQLPHRALPDAAVTAAHLDVMLGEYLARGFEDSSEALTAYTASLIDVLLMPYGKHEGERLETIPADYLCWALDNMDDIDDDLRYSLQKAYDNVPLDQLRMTFGKHEGVPIVKVPRDYLRWALENATLGTTLRRSIEQIYRGETLDLATL